MAGFFWFGGLLWFYSSYMPWGLGLGLTVEIKLTHCLDCLDLVD